MARAREQADYGENLLVHPYLIRERLASLELQAAELEARTGTK
jgi:hypothetical protein